jgi:hypothetical protein
MNLNDKNNEFLYISTHFAIEILLDNHIFSITIDFHMLLYEGMGV